MKAPFCMHPFEKMHINCEGQVFMCCYQRQYPIGNALEEGIIDIWFGAKAEAVRAEILRGVLPPVCLDGGCPFEIIGTRPSKVTPEFRPPFFLSVDLPNTHCNIGGESPSAARPACLMCERSLPDYRFQNDNRFPEIFPRLKQLLPWLRVIHVQGVAEPFWKDAIYEVLDGLEYERLKKQITVAMVTNGTLLNEAKIRKFLEFCPRNSLSFSIDAGTPETYRKIRRLDAYDVVVNNVATVSRLRKSRKDTFLKIQNNINMLNVHEVVEMVRVAKKTGADELELNPTGGHPAEILVSADNHRVFLEAQKLAVKEAKALGVKLSLLRPLDMGFSKKSG